MRSSSLRHWNRVHDQCRMHIRVCVCVLVWIHYSLAPLHMCMYICINISQSKWLTLLTERPSQCFPLVHPSIIRLPVSAAALGDALTSHVYKIRALRGGENQTTDLVQCDTIAIYQLQYTCIVLIWVAVSRGFEMPGTPIRGCSVIYFTISEIHKLCRHFPPKPPLCSVIRRINENCTSSCYLQSLHYSHPTVPIEPTCPL